MDENVCGNCLNFGTECDVTDPDSPVNDCNEWIDKNSTDDIYEQVITVFKDYSEKTDDHVNHPSHYTQGGVECIEAIRASMSPSGFQDYCKGNVLKYIWRFRGKGGLEDLAKAQVYLSWLIDSVEKEQNERR